MIDQQVRPRPAPAPSRRAPRVRCAAALLATVVLVAAAVSAAAAQDAPAPPRIPPLESAEGGINITRTLANHPALAEAWLTFARYVLGDNTLPPRDRELLILRIGYLWRLGVRVGPAHPASPGPSASPTARSCA